MIEYHMKDLKLICYTCGYEHIINEREFIEDIQKCSNCGSENIEIVPNKDEPEEKLIDPSEKKGMVRRRFMIILAIGILFIIVGIVFINVGGLMIALLVIGVILTMIAYFWWTTPS
jgi:hypothetical protein